MRGRILHFKPVVINAVLWTEVGEGISMAGCGLGVDGNRTDHVELATIDASLDGIESYPSVITGLPVQTGLVISNRTTEYHQLKETGRRLSS